MFKTDFGHLVIHLLILANAYYKMGGGHQISLGWLIRVEVVKPEAQVFTTYFGDLVIHLLILAHAYYEIGGGH